MHRDPAQRGDRGGDHAHPHTKCHPDTHTGSVSYADSHTHPECHPLADTNAERHSDTHPYAEQHSDANPHPR
jgi:hypothetical protein